MRSRQSLAPQFLVAATLVATPNVIVGCARSESAPAARSPVAVKSGDIVVRRGPFERVLPLTGEIDAVTAASLKVPRVPNGKVTIRSLALEGAEVKKGDVVAELDSTSFVAQIKERVLQLNQAEIDLERQASQNGVQIADKALDVETKRAAVGRAEIDADVPPGILPKRDYLEKQLALRRARVELEKSQEALAAIKKTSELDMAVKRLSVDKIRRAVKVAEESIEALTLKAPADGVVILGEHYLEGRKLQETDDAFMGQTIVRVASSGARRVRAWLSDVDDGRLALDMQSRVALDAHPTKLFHGKIVEIAPVARAPSERSQRRVFQVLIELAESDTEILRPGLSARVDVIVDRKPDALLAPRVALDLGAVPAKALLASGGSAEIVLGGCAGEVCAVSAGLEEGARLRRFVP